MSAELIIRTEGFPDRRHQVGVVCTIGRSPANDLTIDNTYVSKHHCVIRRQSDLSFSLVDLGSSNGTFLNGRRVTIPVQLKNGDEIGIGGSRLELAIQEVPDLVVSPQSAELHGTEVRLVTETISILVIDIRNYTGLSEAVPAEQLSVIIGKWFKQVQGLIEQQGGEIDKYIGDAVMAIWKKAQSEDDITYVHAPLEVAKEAVALAGDYDSVISCTYPPHRFAVGCGIHTGQAVVGNVGELTVMGDCVNVAFRIEGLCKPLGRPILLSEDVKAAAHGAFDYEDLGPQQIRGKSGALHIFALKV